jgi:S1-C subfamily serine protease
MDVTPGGPAEKAGIKAGDVIASVNGKPASSIRLTDMRTALRDEAPGTVMHFEVERAGQQKAIDVTMRDQI